MNASEPLKTCRKRRNEVETGRESLPRDERGRSLFGTAWPPALRWHDSVAWPLGGNVGTFRADGNRAVQAEALQEPE